MSVQARKTMVEIIHDVPRNCTWKTTRHRLRRRYLYTKRQNDGITTIGQAQEYYNYRQTQSKIEQSLRSIPGVDNEPVRL